MVNVEVQLTVVEWVDVDWIGLTRDGDKWKALVSMVMNPRIL
jgi:hypothetical protein